jgi:hypothetical protein
MRPCSSASFLRYSTTNGEPTKWRKPNLRHKPVISPRRKLDFLQRKQEHDKEREAKRVRVTLTAEHYNSLEVSAPLLTTMKDLASMFCQARSIDIEANQSTVFMYDEIPHSDCGLSLTSTLYAYPYEKLREYETGFVLFPRCNSASLFVRV